MPDIVREIRETPARGITILRTVVHVPTAQILSFGDSAFATAENVKSQGGGLIGLTHNPQQVILGHYNLFTLVCWRSGTIKRVVRSTISAEGNSVVEEQEQGEYLRQVLAEWYSSPHTPLRKIEDDLALRRPLVVVSDSNSLVDAVLSDKGRVQDKRLRIVIAMIKEAVQPGRNVSLNPTLYLLTPI